METSLEIEMIVSDGDTGFCTRPYRGGREPITTQTHSRDLNSWIHLTAVWYSKLYKPQEFTATSSNLTASRTDVKEKNQSMIKELRSQRWHENSNFRFIQDSRHSAPTLRPRRGQCEGRSATGNRLLLLNFKLNASSSGNIGRVDPEGIRPRSQQASWHCADRTMK